MSLNIRADLIDYWCTKGMYIPGIGMTVVYRGVPSIPLFFKGANYLLAVYWLCYGGNITIRTEDDYY